MCNCLSNHQVAHIASNVIFAKNLAGFRQEMRYVTRQYWNGDLLKGDFVFRFFDVVEHGFIRAFRAGAATCGIRPKEYTNKMKARLQQRIAAQFGYIVKMSKEIVIRANDGKLGSAFRRIEIWIARYGEIKQLGTILACGDKKLKWIIGIAEHCKSCIKLNGKVKRASFWNETGILPRVAGAVYLDCKGYNCKCSLVPTDEPISKGRLPTLP